MNYSEMEQEIKNLKEEGIVLKTQISEMRQSEERLFRLVVIVVFALIGANFWYNYKIYDTDKRALQEDLAKAVDKARHTLIKDHKAAMEEQFKTLKDEVLADHKKRFEDIRREMSKDQVEGFAYTLGHVADIQLFLRDVEGAVRAGLEQFDNATRSNTNYQAHALDKLTSAFQIGIQDQKRIPAELLSQAQKLLERSDAISEPRFIKLKETMKSYRATIPY